MTPRTSPSWAKVFGWSTCTAVLCALWLLQGLSAVAAAAEKQDLTQLSIEQLMDVEIEVTSASRRQQKVCETPAAVYVINSEDIRRSGATTIPEALRLAPGMDVARIDANKWAVSCRGFNDLFANKMLVLVDGRSVYTPTFSGVWWDALGVEIEDVDRIEVIRGPGAAIWGANAVNAVVNIITRPASSGRNLTAKLESGSADIESGSSLRFSGPVNGNGGYRFYASQTDYNALDRVGGGTADDAWDRSSAGIRMDWKPSAATTVTCQANTYRGNDNQDLTTNLEFPDFSEILSDAISVSGTNLLARWSQQLSPTSDRAFQFYLDRANREDEVLYGESLLTYDLDYEQHASAGKHDLVWGLGYRLTNDTVSPGMLVKFRPPHRRQNLFSGFLNDEISLANDHLRLTLGTKVEHNEFTGLEIQPSARLLWPLGERRALWSAVSRATRVPSRLERDIIFTLDDIPDGEGGRVKFLSISTPDFDSEELLAYEIGYRDHPTQNLSFDLTCFLNDYSKILALKAGEPYADGSDTIYPNYISNCISGRTYGAELSADYKVTDGWRLAGSYSLLHADLSLSPDCTDTLSLAANSGSAPTSQFNVRSYFDLPRNCEFDVALYSCGALWAKGAPSYTRLDGRFSWRSSDGTDVSIQVTNALNSRHVEFGSYYGETASLLGRGISATIARQF